MCIVCNSSKDFRVKKNEAANRLTDRTLRERQGWQMTTENAYTIAESFPTWPSDADQDYAERVLRARYYSGVRRRAEAYVTELRAGGREDPAYNGPEEFHDRLRQNIDSDHDVIYTHEARRVAYCSDYVNDSYEYIESELCSEPTTELVALVCLEHDVLECIEQELGMPIHEWFESEANMSDASDDLPKVYEIYCSDVINALTIRRKHSQIPYSIDYTITELGTWVNMNGAENYVTYHFRDVHQLNKAELELTRQGWSKK